MNWTYWVRRVHRWLAAAFTMGFLFDAVVIFGLGDKHPAFWVYLLVLIPLWLLLPTGLYLFVLPYVARWSGRPRAGGALAERG
jgi:hypothetical protein